MTMIANYPSKKALKESIGKRLKAEETSMFGAEYPADGNGSVYVTNEKRSWFARVHIKDHLITAVK